MRWLDSNFTSVGESVTFEKITDAKHSNGMSGILKVTETVYVLCVIFHSDPLMAHTGEKDCFPVTF